MKRPFFMLRAGRNWSRDRGYVLTLIVAPYPEAEQEPGRYARAMVNLRVMLDHDGWRPVIWFDLYAPRRDRLGEPT